MIFIYIDLLHEACDSNVSLSYFVFDFDYQHLQNSKNIRISSCLDC